MKVKHIQECPICHGELREDKVNPLLPKPGKYARVQTAGQVFICCSPLAENPLHYYSHTVLPTDPDWMAEQEFTVNIGSRYVMFYNNYLEDKSCVQSNHQKDPMEIKVLLIPDFPSLENLVRKIKLSLTFS